MPCGRLSAESSVLFSHGWETVGNRSESTKLWEIDRHGRWRLDDVLFVPGGMEKPVYLGTQGGFGVLTASSRVTLRSGSAIKAASIIHASNIGQSWFEIPVGPPEEPMLDVGNIFGNALRELAIFESDDWLVVKRCWPSGQRARGRLESAVQSVKSGGSEYIMLKLDEISEYAAENWVDAVTSVVQLCFINEEGLAEFDRSNATLIAWYLSALRSQRAPYRLSYEAMQNSRRIYVNLERKPLPPIALGGCACLGAVSTQTVQVDWVTGGWSPVAGDFFLRGR
jgi:hypothetical protein